MMVGYDDIQAVFFRPRQRLKRARSRVNADDQRITFFFCFFEIFLVKPVTFAETMRNVKAGLCAENL